MEKKYGRVILSFCYYFGRKVVMGRRRRERLTFDSETLLSRLLAGFFHQEGEIGHLLTPRSFSISSLVRKWAINIRNTAAYSRFVHVAYASPTSLWILLGGDSNFVRINTLCWHCFHCGNWTFRFPFEILLTHVTLLYTAFTSSHRGSECGRRKLKCE